MKSYTLRPETFTLNFNLMLLFQGTGHLEGPRVFGAFTRHAFPIHLPLLLPDRRDSRCCMVLLRPFLRHRVDTRHRACQEIVSAGGVPFSLLSRRRLFSSSSLLFFSISFPCSSSSRLVFSPLFSSSHRLVFSALSALAWPSHGPVFHLPSQVHVDPHVDAEYEEEG